MQYSSKMLTMFIKWLFEGAFAWKKQLIPMLLTNNIHEYLILGKSAIPKIPQSMADYNVSAVHQHEYDEWANDTEACMKKMIEDKSNFTALPKLTSSVMVNMLATSSKLHGCQVKCQKLHFPRTATWGSVFSLHRLLKEISVTCEMLCYFDQLLANLCSCVLLSAAQVEYFWLIGAFFCCCWKQLPAVDGKNENRQKQ